MLKAKEKGKNTQLNAKLQRKAKMDKKDFLNEQYKATEESNRIRMTRDLFKKIGDIKGIFHARMGTIKDKNGKDIKKSKRD